MSRTVATIPYLTGFDVKPLETSPIGVVTLLMELTTLFQISYNVKLMDILTTKLQELALLLDLIQV